MDLLAEQTRLMEPTYVKECGQIPAAIRVWENALVDLREKGRPEYDISANIRRNIFIKR